jgi:uncharacterized protein (TIGR03083 family)
MTTIESAATTIRALGAEYEVDEAQLAAVSFLARYSGRSRLFVRQRRRLEAMFASLSDDDWRAPTRCENWSVQDVGTHLDGVNGFFHSAIAEGLAGTPTRVLEGFDPGATPAAMVDAVSAKAPADILAELVQDAA